MPRSRASSISRSRSGTIARWFSVPIPAFSIWLSGSQKPFCMSITSNAAQAGSM